MNRAATIFHKLSAAALKLPIQLYRYTISPLIGQHCRHVPSCSQYGIDAIERNGAWRGFWLTLSRVLRCHPWGTSGFDPAPDICQERHSLWMAWRYGRWNRKQVDACHHAEDHH